MLGREPVRRRERALLAAAVARRSPAWRRPAKLLTDLAAPPVVAAAVATAAVWAVRRGVPTASALRTLAAAGVGIGLRRGLAEAVRRERPPAAWWWDAPTGHSYPSRHVTWAVLGYGAVADLLTAAGSPGGSSALRAIPPAAVAVSRVVLAVHWPSDVLAGGVFASAWRQLTVTPGDPRSAATSCSRPGVAGGFG